MKTLNVGIFPVCVIAMLFFFGAHISSFAGNIITISSGDAGPGENISVEVIINNTDDFVAFQLDIPLPEQLNYVEGTAELNPDRITDDNLYAVEVSEVSGNILRIISYSIINQPFLGNSGPVMHFDLVVGTVPGEYLLEPTNAIIAGTDGTNIITSTTQGTITILGPNIKINPESLDFGEVALESHHELNLSVTNAGNLNLEVTDLTFDSPWFSILQSSEFTLPPGGNKSLTVRFEAQEAGVFQQEMTIHSNDHETPERIIALDALAYAINELHTGSMLSFSGEHDLLEFTINNMEDFVGFQFDMKLPDPLTYIQGSATLSDRKTDHEVSANIIDGNTLRVIAYSPSNQAFQEDDGHILNLTFEVFGTGGIYPLILSEVIIGNSDGINILSSYYNGSLEVAAPDIIVHPQSIDFEDVSVVDTGQKTVQINNAGSNDLIINALQIDNDAFFIEQETPVILEPSATHELQVFFHHAEKGSQHGTLSIYSNDPDENPFEVGLSAFAFAPNYMYVEDTGAESQGTAYIDILVDNQESFIAFQFKLFFPDHIMSFLPDATHTHLTDRADDHELVTGIQSDGSLLVFAYSMEGAAFSGHSGSIVRLGFEVEAPQAGISYELNLEDVILADNEQQNILYDFINGHLHILEALVCPDDLEINYDADPFDLTGGTPEGGTYAGPGVSNGTFDPKQAGTGEHVIIYSYSYDNGFFAECAFYITVTSFPTEIFNHTVSDGEETCFDALQTIITGGSGHFVVESGAQVKLIAGENIVMLPGTHFKKGSYVNAYITTDGSFCGDMGKHFLAVEEEDSGKEEKTEEPTDIADITKDIGDFFKVYPNPTEGTFTLEFTFMEADDNIKVEVYGMFGEQVFSKQLLPQRVYTISLEGYQPGMYIIRVKKGDRLGVKRLIKR